MKKSLFIIVLLTFIGITSMAQKMSLCQAFGTLTQQSDSGFVRIKGAQKESGVFTTTFASKIEISEAIKTEIYVMTTSTEFVVDYGSFATESEAIVKVETLKKNFMYCFPVVRFSDYKIDLFKSRQTNMIQQAEKGFGYYKAHFKINTLNDTYNVSFIYPSSSVRSLFGRNEPNITEFITVPMPLDNQQYAQDIRKIIEESKTAFASIKGEKLEVTLNGFDCYTTTFKIDGVSNCYIEDRTMDILNYVIPIVKDADITTIQKTVDVYLGNFMAALGPDYAFNVSKNQQVFDFVHKNRPFQKIATFYIEPNANLFNLTIYISSYIQK
jgi:hypothetical protein